MNTQVLLIFRFFSWYHIHSIKTFFIKILVKIVIYRSVCATESCNEDYVGECCRRLCECVKDHNGRDHLSHLVKHAGETGHLPVDTANFEVIGSGYRNNARRRKIAEALLVKKPILNIQEKSVPLKLFN